jgi:type II secretory pathway pseudopilin PulG
MRVHLSERGMALPLVLMVIAVITILGLAAVWLVGEQEAMTTRFAERESALAIAEAGINEYLWHLNKDSKFYTQDQDFVGADDQPRVHKFQNGCYQLRITSPDIDHPVVTIRSTGWLNRAPSYRRTIEACVHKRQFAQHIFLSHQEKTPPPNLETVWWTTGDEVWGPLHTNGDLNLSGNPHFHDVVTYSGKLNLERNSKPQYDQGVPEKTAQLTFPASNSQLKTQARYNGYYYSGRTCILLEGNQLHIWNKKRNEERNEDGSETRPLPPNGVIYVDGNLPKNTEQSKWCLDTGNVFVSGQLDGQLTIAAAGDIYITGKDPTNFDYNKAGETGGIKYTNSNVKGGEGMSYDMLGLVAGRYVRILHHYWPSDKKHRQHPYYDNSERVRDVAPQAITIHAAIFALEGAFEFEDYCNSKCKGDITLMGSITQKYRGAVGTFQHGGGRISGYTKKYTHDPRMRYDTPPHFLEPINAGWEIKEWREVK